MVLRGKIVIECIFSFEWDYFSCTNNSINWNISSRFNTFVSHNLVIILKGESSEKTKLLKMMIIINSFWCFLNYQCFRSLLIVSSAFSAIFNTGWKLSWNHSKVSALPPPTESCSLTLRESVHIRSFLWSVFSGIWTEYGKIQIRKNSVFGHFSHSVNESLILRMVVRQIRISFKTSGVSENFGTWMLFFTWSLLGYASPQITKIQRSCLSLRHRTCDTCQSALLFVRRM